MAETAISSLFMSIVLEEIQIYIFSKMSTKLKIIALSAAADAKS